MTVVGAGGLRISAWRKSRRFHKEYDKLAVDLRDLVDQKLQDLTRNPLPPGLRFEKLKGHSDPDIYTLHVTGNYKISMEINGSEAFLRRVADHNDIDRAP
jgi:mRNA-degrading endonuclease RelE of RelBE toxin-antitoxin system